MTDTDMYRVKPVFILDGEFKHTSSMYKLKPVNINPCINQTMSTMNPALPETDIINRQEKLLNDLNLLLKQIGTIREKIDANRSGVESAGNSGIFSRFQEADISDIVINADPKYPPYALLWLPKLWNVPLNISVHLHSSVPVLPEKLNLFMEKLTVDVDDKLLPKVTLIWKEVGPDAQLIISPIRNKVILGEVNILRFFETFLSETEDILIRIRNNEILDLVHKLNHVSGKEVYTLVSKLSNFLGVNTSFTQTQHPSVVDAAVWSVLCRKTKLNALPSNIKNWASSHITALGVNCFNDS